jgi:hypothetical protein
MCNPTNYDRAKWAAEAVEAFMVATGAELADAVPDLLCDLMHFCDRTPGVPSFNGAMRRADEHYTAELEEEREQFGTDAEGIAFTIYGPEVMEETGEDGA